MKNNVFETIVGTLVLLIAFIFFWFAISLSKNSKDIDNGYVLVAEFNNIGDLTIGSDVKISGVKIGSVAEIKLNKENYNAVVVLNIQKDINIPIDSIFKISSNGLMGGKFINVKIGGDESFLNNKSTAEYTESNIDLEDLISRFVFSNDKK
jgi:phospholipid/cholesterol/gamma-HCH transport system substrate-binding protein